jgi:hypothetical protein
MALDTDHKEKTMDEGLTLMRTTRKGVDENSNEINGLENWTRNEEADENTNEAGMII